MTSTEERLRAATRAAGDTVPPGIAPPPLRLPAKPARRSALQRRLRMMTPMAAAAAVVAVVFASLTLTSGMREHDGGSQSSAAGPGGPAGVPAFYAALTGQAEPMKAVIRSTRTGTVLATVRPPRPYGTFTFVTGAADDRTFVLAARRWWPIASGTRGLAAEKRNNTTQVAFFRLRFDPVTGSARLTRLSPLSGPQSAQLGGIGLSPDGTRLALALRTVTASSGPGQPALRGPGIHLVTLATGAVRDWAWPGGGYVGNSKPMGEPLSWTADGRSLAFQEWNGVRPQIRVLDTTAPGADLRSSRLVVNFTKGTRPTLGGSNSLMTPDGTAVVAATVRYQQHPNRSELQISEYATRTGRMTRALDRWRLGTRGVSWQDVLWTNSSGSTLIVVTPPRPTTGIVSLDRPVGPVAGILTSGGQFTPLPGLSIRTTNVAW